MAERRKFRQWVKDSVQKYGYKKVAPNEEIIEENLRISTYRRGKSTLVIADAIEAEAPLQVSHRIGMGRFRVTTPIERKTPITHIDARGFRASTTVHVPVEAVTIDRFVFVELKKSLLQHGDVGFGSRLEVEGYEKVPLISVDNSGGAYLNGDVEKATVGKNARLEATNVQELQIGSDEESYGAKARLKGRIDHLILLGNTNVIAYSVGKVSGESIGNDTLGTKTGKVDNQDEYVSPTPLHLYDKDIVEYIPPFTIPEINE